MADGPADGSRSAFRVESGLALLDYISRTHEIKIRPSIVCPAVCGIRLSLKLLHGFLSNFICCFPWAICPDVFSFLEKNFFFIFLALLDSVSRGHGMGLLSVVRPSVCPSVCPFVCLGVPRAHYIGVITSLRCLAVCL